ncbi:MAG: MBL fold metallo-hydrolase [Candidatus Saccharimonadales bacterium]|nr:MBL fold metallo-hydrolase [Candidatus Saccharimonadales bacterium]
MEFQFRGANCMRLATKDAVIFTDPVIGGVKVKTDKATTVLATQKSLLGEHKEGIFTVDTPGEYELSGVSIHGIPVRGHMEEEGKESAVMYKIMTSDLNVLVTGHIFPKLTDEELETIGHIDVLVVPVGGNGYTLDATGAVAVIRAIEPKLVIPTHYKDSGVKYEVPQSEIKLFLDELGVQSSNDEDKLKVKGANLPEVLSVTVLNRTA